ncbi:Sulfotransferase family protein [Catalinimonas alkaloidigena]|uniref:Sulfotransferase family protein n=2 Tax=Catalinimonas alkaloidigena TaxID=1075417 RepID=A0A1G9LN09_9BACT|nr:Sulfotransferase family protein [Catalinimonas alkaloidigena]
MLGSMLSAHPNYQATPESQFKNYLFNWFDYPDTLQPDECRRILDFLPTNFRFRLWNLVADKEALLEACRTRSIGGLLVELARQYAWQVARNAHATVWIDHSPDNISLTRELLHYLPEARFIHIVRDGRAIAASVLPLDWGPNTIKGAADLWTQRLAQGFTAEQALKASGRFTTLRYEDLVCDPEMTLRKLCAEINLEFHPNMLTGNGLQTTVYNSRQHALVGKAPEKDRINAWEEQLQPRQIEIFEWMTEPMLRNLDYPLKFNGKARAPKRTEWLQMEVEHYLGKVKNVIRRKKRIKRALLTAPKTSISEQRVVQVGALSAGA